MKVSELTVCMILHAKKLKIKAKVIQYVKVFQLHKHCTKSVDKAFRMHNVL